MEEKEFIDKLYQAHQQARPGIHLNTVGSIAEQLLKLLFPVLCDCAYNSKDAFVADFLSFKTDLLDLLTKVPSGQSPPEVILDQFITALPTLTDLMHGDAAAILSGDPAAVDGTEVIRTYPGFYAIAIYRIAHSLCNLDTKYLPRLLTEYAHTKTGIDIHPGAVIGKRFCIDHGTGVVIGETVEIGNDVKLYQGVTLGALSVTKAMAKMKRHPTIEDNVLIYANATILGGETVIGARSVIGGNVWVTQSVAADSRVYYREGRDALVVERK